MSRIKLLSPDLINKIAAGEVVERPASVVEELAENAIDAKATSIRVQLSEGGLSAITIIDDGHGMSAQDARLSLERHATSKLADQEALFHILTKGFRGEALPTIASVSHFALQTSEPGAVSGTKVHFDERHNLLVEEAPALGGTRIDVLDLFYNTPARRKFLKRESTELAHCEEAVIRLALAHPEIGFSVEHGERRLFSSQATAQEPKERIAAALGVQVAPHLLAIDERRLGVTVTGHVASPEYTLPTARGLYTFVNHRYIRDRGLNSAIQRAFQDSLPPGRQPVAVIHIELDPRAVDVNVHPQKLEVRFADPRSVQEAVGVAISRALRAAPWRNAEQPTTEATQAHYAMAVDRFLSRASPSAFEPSPSVAEGEHPGFGTARPDINTAPPPGFFATLKYLGELGRRFWVCEGQGGTLVVIDPRAARERILLQALTDSFSDGSLASAAPTLFSQRIELPFDDAKLLEAVSPALLKLGIELEPFGGDSVAVKRVPAGLEAVNLRDLLLELADSVPLGAPEDFGPALKVMASHATEAPLRSVTHDEAHRVLAQLDDLDFSISAEHGRVVVRQTPLLELVGQAD